jgi:hypothetical protein
METLILPICYVALISAHTITDTETIEINHWFGMFVLKIIRKIIKRWKEIVIGLSMIDFLMYDWIYTSIIIVYITIGFIIGQTKKYQDLLDNNPLNNQ